MQGKIKFFDKEIMYYIDFRDVLIKPCVSNINSRKEVDLAADFSDFNPLMRGWKPIPIMSANMDTVTGFDMAIALCRMNLVPVFHKFVSIAEIKKAFDILEEENIDFRNLFISRGITETDKTKLAQRLEAEPRIKSVCIDVANGHTEKTFEYIKALKEGICKDKIVMVGNIAADEESVRRFAEAKADIIKVGIGQGSGCLTRVETGVGMPQLGATLEINYFLRAMGSNMLICSDGGCEHIGDIAKSFVAGAEFVMLGGMFAAHDECPGDVEHVGSKKMMRFSGMAAKESQQSGVPEYGIAEGKTVFLELRGPVELTVKKIEGGLRSSCTYANSRNILELQNAQFVLTHIQENTIFDQTP